MNNIAMNIFKQVCLGHVLLVFGKYVLSLSKYLKKNCLIMSKCVL